MRNFKNFKKKFTPKQIKNEFDPYDESVSTRHPVNDRQQKILTNQDSDDFSYVENEKQRNLTNTLNTRKLDRKDWNASEYYNSGYKDKQTKFQQNISSVPNQSDDDDESLASTVAVNFRQPTNLKSSHKFDLEPDDFLEDFVLEKQRVEELKSENKKKLPQLKTSDFREFNQKTSYINPIETYKQPKQQPKTIHSQGIYHYYQSEYYKPKASFFNEDESSLEHEPPPSNMVSTNRQPPRKKY
jgi:hypothetical protein